MSEPKKNYDSLIADIGFLLEQGRKNAYYTVNSILVKTYWEIGKRIVEYEQYGKLKAEYGSLLLSRLSKDLSKKHGKGFSKSNVYFMRNFYVAFKKFQTVSGKLSWSHYVELLGIDNPLERLFYEKQCINENWSLRELRRQKNTALFTRLALSKNKEGVMKLSKQGLLIKKAEDLIKDPYVLEFLGVSEQITSSEKDLEQKIIDNLQMFLLELGKGFSFVGRQYRITLGNKHYYVDLVFYHKILKCFILIDLKIDRADYSDVGQMNTYLNYFKSEICSKDDNSPIGIVLAKEKNSIEIQYALGGISNNLFVSKYLLCLPDKKELEDRIRKILSK